VSCVVRLRNKSRKEEEGVKKLQRIENKEMESCIEQKKKGSVGLEGIAKEAAQREEEKLRY